MKTSKIIYSVIATLAVLLFAATCLLTNIHAGIRELSFLIIPGGLAALYVGYMRNPLWHTVPIAIYILPAIIFSRMINNSWAKKADNLLLCINLAIATCALCALSWCIGRMILYLKKIFKTIYK